MDADADATTMYRWMPMPVILVQLGVS